MGQTDANAGGSKGCVTDSVFRASLTQTFDDTVSGMEWALSATE